MQSRLLAALLPHPIPVKCLRGKSGTGGRHSAVPRVSGWKQSSRLAGKPLCRLKVRPGRTGQAGLHGLAGTAVPTPGPLRKPPYPLWASVSKKPLPPPAQAGLHRGLVERHSAPGVLASGPSVTLPCWAKWLPRAAVPGICDARGGKVTAEALAVSCKPFICTTLTIIRVAQKSKRSGRCRGQRRALGRQQAKGAVLSRRTVPS